MNLGSFAGGLASGYQAGEKLNIAKSDAASLQKAREQQTAIASEKHGWDKVDREAAGVMSKDMQTKYAEFYNDDVKPGMDPAKDFRFNVEVQALSFKHGKADPKALAEAAKLVQEQSQTEMGKSFFAAMGGDQNEMGKIAAKAGLDPTKTRFVQEGGKRLFTDGTNTVDVTMIGASLAGAKFLESITKIQEAEQGTELHKSNLAKNQANIAQSNAQTNVLIPAQAAASRSSAFASGERGNLYKAQAKGKVSGAVGVDPKASKAISDVLKAVPMSQDAAPVLQRLAEVAVSRGMSPQAAAKSAGATYAQWMASAKKAGKGEADVLAELRNRITPQSIPDDEEAP